jgi:hypothetical protein
MIKNWKNPRSLNKKMTEQIFIIQNITCASLYFQSEPKPVFEVQKSKQQYQCICEKMYKHKESSTKKSKVSRIVLTFFHGIL